MKSSLALLLLTTCLVPVVVFGAGREQGARHQGSMPIRCSHAPRPGLPQDEAMIVGAHRLHIATIRLLGTGASAPKIVGVRYGLGKDGYNRVAARALIQHFGKTDRRRNKVAGKRYDLGVQCLIAGEHSHVGISYSIYHPAAAYADGASQAGLLENITLSYDMKF